MMRTRTRSTLLIGLVVVVGSVEARDLPPNWYAIKGPQADSAWALEPWSVSVGYKSGYSFGDLLSEEKDMADDLDFQVKQYGKPQDAVIHLQKIGISIEGWHRAGTSVDVGLEWSHRWTLESASGEGIGLLLSSNTFMLGGRWFPLRRLVWELGPQLGFGYEKGTLARFPILQDATYSGPYDGGETEYWLGKANEDLAVSGPRVEIGGAMEVRVTHWCSFGGTLLLGRTSWSIDDPDPLDATNVGYPSSPTEYDIELELHAAYRF